MNPIDYGELPLRDIHLPASIPWWPPAVGWWVLLACVGAAVVVAWLASRRRYRERAAIAGLKAVARALTMGTEPVLCIQRISMILRRFAMSVGESRNVAGLTGEDWLAFLDDRWARDEFASGIGRTLIFGPYAPPDRVTVNEVGAINELCMDWVRAQRPPER